MTDPNKKISALSSGAPVQDTDEFVIARSGDNYRLSWSDLGGGSSGLNWAYLSAGGTATSISPSSTTQLTADHTTFYTNASSTFDVALNGSSIYGIRLLASGHYLFWISARPTIIPTAGDEYELIVVGGGEFPDFQFAPLGMVFPTGGNIDDGIVSTGGVMNVGGSITAPTTPITGEISNSSSSHTLHFEMAGIVVIQLDATSSDLT